MAKTYSGFDEKMNMNQEIHLGQEETNAFFEDGRSLNFVADDPIPPSNSDLFDPISSWWGD